MPKDDVAPRSARARESRAPEEAPNESASAVATASRIVVGSIVLVAVAFVLGGALGWSFTKLRAAPLYGRIDPTVGPWVVLPVGLAAAGVTLAPRFLRLRWGRALVAGSGLSMAWIFAVNWWRTPRLRDYADDLHHEANYTQYAELFASPLDVFRDYLERFDQLAFHAASHPPGPVALVATVENLTGRSLISWWAIGITAIAATTVAAVALTVRHVSDDHTARLLIPFLALAPWAIWSNTTLDAVFMAAAAWVTYAWVRSESTPARVGSGAIFGALLMMSYGMVVFLVIPVAMAWPDRRKLMGGALGGAAALVAVWALGFPYHEGIAATREYYVAGVGGARALGYFFVANPAATVIAAGPVVGLSVAAAMTQRSPMVGRVTLAALAAVAFLTISGLTKGEVERQWVLFFPYLLAGAPAAVTRLAAARGVTVDRSLRDLCGLQVVWAVGISALLSTPW